MQMGGEVSTRLVASDASRTWGTRHEHHARRQRSGRRDVAGAHARHEARGRRHPRVGRRSRQALLRRSRLAARRGVRRGETSGSMQFTPPGSPCSVIFGTERHLGRAGLGAGPPSHRLRHRGGARRSRRRGVEVSEVFHDAGGVFHHAGERPRQRPGSRAAQLRARSPRSAIRTATAGCSRRSPRGCPDASTRRHDLHLAGRARGARCGVRRPRTASTRSGPASRMRTGRTGTPSTSSGSSPDSPCPHERARHARATANCQRGSAALSESDDVWHPIGHGRFTDAAGRKDRPDGRSLTRGAEASQRLSPHGACTRAITEQDGYPRSDRRAPSSR